jgi:hypothetical protein
MPQTFQIKNDSSQTQGLHSKIQINIRMLIKLCVGNYATHNGLFNGVDGVFQYVTKLQNNESFIWIGFNNPKIQSTIRIQNRHLYTTHIHDTWTPIQPNSKEIQLEKI